MKRYNKILGVALSLCILTTMLPVQALAQETNAGVQNAATSAEHTTLQDMSSEHRNEASGSTSAATSTAAAGHTQPSEGGQATDQYPAEQGVSGVSAQGAQTPSPNGESTASAPDTQAQTPGGSGNSSAPDTRPSEGQAGAGEQTQTQKPPVDENDMIKDEGLKKAINDKLKNATNASDEDKNRTELQNITKADLDRLQNQILTSNDITELILTATEIQNWSELALFDKINGLAIQSSKTPVDIGQLTGLKLEQLRITNSSIVNMEALKAFAATMTYLDASGCGLQDQDIRSISELKALRTLYLDKNYITNIEFVAGLEYLIALNMSDNQIRNIKPIENLRDLIQLVLPNNQIEDLTPVANLSNLMVLAVANNQIKTLAPLSNMAAKGVHFTLTGNQIADFSPISIPLKKHSSIEARDQKVTIRTDSDEIANPFMVEGKPISLEKATAGQAVKVKDIGNGAKFFFEGKKELQKDERRVFKFEDQFGDAIDPSNVEQYGKNIKIGGEVTVIKTQATVNPPKQDNKVGGGGAGSKNNNTNNSNKNQPSQDKKKPQPAAPTRSIVSVERAAHGSVELNKSRAEKGERVTITVKPDKGYKVKEILVKDKDGREVRVKENKDGTYSFDMPSKEVQIIPSFVQIEEKKPAPSTMPTVQTVQQKVSLKIGSKTLNKTTDGKMQSIQSDAAPFIRNGRTMLPVRYAAEALGLEVQWDKTSRTVILKDADKEIRLPLDSGQMIVGAKVIQSDMPPLIEGSRTYLSISNLAKALKEIRNVEVAWDAATKEVTITRA